MLKHCIGIIDIMYMHGKYICLESDVGILSWALCFQMNY